MHKARTWSERHEPYILFHAHCTSICIEKININNNVFYVNKKKTEEKTAFVCSAMKTAKENDFWTLITAELLFQIAANKL